MTDAYRDARLPVEARVEDLLRRLTRAEKIGQVQQPVAAYARVAGKEETIRAFVKRDGKAELTEEFLTLLDGPGIGSVYGLLRSDMMASGKVENGLAPAEGAELSNRLQRLAIARSRWGIPLIFNEECSHGHAAIDAVVFPVPLLVASTWNPDLYQRMLEITALEARAVGATMTCSPVLDIVRDPRWGRMEETYGEDPYLAGRLAQAAIRGLQGENLASDHAIAATIKHFAAYGLSAGGHNAAPAPIGPRELRDVVLYPFEQAVRAGAAAVMASYNEIDGVPSSGNRWLLTDLLRGEWGFNGVVISDWGSTDQLCAGHRVATDLKEAAALTMNAGLDIELFVTCFRQPLVDALDQGLVSEARLDEAVRRVLRLKVLLGLFEQPYVDPARAAALVGCAEHRAVAREVARQGIVLLKNDGNLLPLAPELPSIAVIGPNADSVYNQLGDYTGPQRAGAVATVLAGIRAAVGPATDVRYAKGCGIRHPSTDGFAEAVAAAKTSSVAVVVVGGSSSRYAENATVDPNTGATIIAGDSLAQDMETGEGVDRAGLDLSGVQLALVQAVVATGTPTVVVLINGRPQSIPWIAENAPALLEAWYPGQEGGHAVADILFGAANPAGRLTISLPRSVGQLPVYYNYKPEARRPYVDSPETPLFPFGFGLSYTTFAYENLRVEPGVISPDGEARISVDVVNTGARAGDEVVQLYIRDEVASVTRPVKELKGFQRLPFASGERRTVAFTLSAAALAFTGLQLQRVVEPGAFTVMVGGNSIDVLTATLEVRGEAKR